MRKRSSLRLYADLGAIVIEDEEPKSRRQVALRARRIDGPHHFRQGQAPRGRDLLQSLLERIFEASEPLVAGDDDRAFDDRRLYDPLRFQVNANSGGGIVEGAGDYAR